MSNEFLTEDEIKALVAENMDKRFTIADVRDVVESGAIPRLERAEPYYGKVRANFFGPELVTPTGIPLRVLIATAALSTHDKVRGHVPFKGQVLTQMSNYMLDIVGEALPSSQLATPGPNVVIAENCEMLDVEMVLRKFMAKSSTTTSLYHHYVNLGEREFCGHALPEGLVANQILPYLMDTPSTKEREADHDLSVSPEYLFEKGIVTPQQYNAIRNACIEAYGMAEAVLAPIGVILVDTKYEVGKNSRGQIVAVDEVLTLDASRYWLKDDYDEKFAAGQPPTSYSKQIARDTGKPTEDLTEDQIAMVAERYIDAFQKLTGQRFEPDLRDPIPAFVADVNDGLEQLLVA